MDTIMPVDVLVPPFGTNVDTVTLVAWYRREGEAVEKDEPLFAVETDKATLDVEAPASGILRQVACPEGPEVAALSRIAVIAAPGESPIDAAGEIDPAKTALSFSRGAGESPIEVAGEIDGDESRRRIPLSSPRERGGLQAGVRGISDPFRELPTPDSPLPPEGEGWPKAGVRGIARTFISPRARRIAEGHGLEWRTLRGTGPEGAIVERDVRAVLEKVPAITPLARRVAEQAGVDWTRMEGSGARGKIVRDDVANAIDRSAGAGSEDDDAFDRSAGAGSEDDDALEAIPIAGTRAVIFERMARSSTETAPVTLTTETDATGLVDLRADARAGGVAVSYNDLLLFILARALREHPRVNASLQGNAVKVWKRIHIGLAVDTERGLLVPVLRDVDRKGLAEIARESAGLVNAARAGRAKPEELRGGTFTLTNLGMYGIDAFTPVINLPECAILGAGRIKPQPAVVGDQIVIRQRMWLSLTFDHRLLDGGPAARFLQRVAQLVEKPHLLLL